LQSNYRKFASTLKHLWLAKKSLLFGVQYRLAIKTSQQDGFDVKMASFEGFDVLRTGYSFILNNLTKLFGIEKVWLF